MTEVASIQRAGCSVCGSAASQRPIFEKWGVDIVECASCGTAAALIPESFDPRDIYSEEYYQGGRSDGYGDYAASESVIRRESQRSLQQLRRCGVKRGNLLEIGCAYGYFLKEAESTFRVTGVEISDAARARALDAGLSVFADIASPEVKARGPFDALVILDCIEHLEDPAGVLRAAADLLADGAAILISTGDWGSPMARLTRRHWRLMTPPQHLFFFTRPGIERLLSPLGFKVVSYERPWRLISLGLAAYMLTHRLKMRVTIPDWLNRVGVPLNLFDCMRVVARRSDARRAGPHQGMRTVRRP